MKTEALPSRARGVDEEDERDAGYVSEIPILTIPSLPWPSPRLSLQRSHLLLKWQRPKGKDYVNQ